MDFIRFNSKYTRNLFFAFRAKKNQLTCLRGELFLITGYIHKKKRYKNVKTYTVWTKTKIEIEGVDIKSIVVMQNSKNVLFPLFKYYFRKIVYILH